MYKVLSLLTFLSVSIVALAQPTLPAAPAVCNTNCITNATIDVCPAGSNNVISSHTNGAYARGGITTLSSGAVWRFRNIASVGGVIINAEISVDQISNAVLDDIDDDDAIDQAGVSIRTFFAPRIGPDRTLNGTDRRGFVQFTMTFFRNANGVNSNTNADFAVAVNLANLNYVHYDIDGNDGGNVNTGTTGSWFRETGLAKRLTPTNPKVLANSVTDLVSYNYTDPVSTNWTGFAGAICERDGISRCAQATSAFSYTGAQPSITFRMGYDYNAGGNIGAPVRQYGSRIGCFNFPSQITLPVRLLSFNAIYNNSVATIKWSADNEINFSKYIVERSSNGADFASIGEAATQLPGSVNNYEYKDNLAGAQGLVFFYRLKLLDKDGKFNFSTTVMVRKEETNITGIVISPTPILSGVATARFSSKKSSSIDIKVVDVSGKVLLRQQNKVYEGNNSVSINNLDQLKPGVYFLQLYNNGEITNSKFSVTR